MFQRLFSYSQHNCSVDLGIPNVFEPIQRSVSSLCQGVVARGHLARVPRWAIVGVHHVTCNQTKRLIHDTVQSDRSFPTFCGVSLLCNTREWRKVHGEEFDDNHWHSYCSVVWLTSQFNNSYCLWCDSHHSLTTVNVLWCDSDHSLTAVTVLWCDSDHSLTTVTVV